MLLEWESHCVCVRRVNAGVNPSFSIFPTDDGRAEMSGSSPG